VLTLTSPSARAQVEGSAEASEQNLYKVSETHVTILANRSTKPYASLSIRKSTKFGPLKSSQVQIDKKLYKNLIRNLGERIWLFIDFGQVLFIIFAMQIYPFFLFGSWLFE